MTLRKTKSSKTGKSPYNIIHGNIMKDNHHNLNPIKLGTLMSDAKKHAYKHNYRVIRDYLDKFQCTNHITTNYKVNHPILSKNQPQYALKEPRPRKPPNYLNDYVLN
ncbi:hypothetical protein A3Q56_01780 [Intoshia linei]|uniref:Uncharacterized protein n=1 Tax=Intoshia linei TaxID=1819745 RepID=A0A177B9Y3_9BILA|nr:hypothetical protein A3Q56_01780 [Intoshia linei]